MSVTVVLPNDVLTDQGGDVPRRVLEQVALEGFKSGQLTIAQVRRILGFDSRLQAHEFLASHGVPWVDYDDGELELETETLSQLVP